MIRAFSVSQPSSKVFFNESSPKTDGLFSRIWASVKGFFETLVFCLFCCFSKRSLAEKEVEISKIPEKPSVEEVLLPRFPEVPRTEKFEEAIQALKTHLEKGEEDYLFLDRWGSHLTPASFTQLIQEEGRPFTLDRLLSLLNKWAVSSYGSKKERTLAEADQPYNEIFNDLEIYKNKAGLSEESEEYGYIYTTLVKFQELSRPDFQELFRLLVERTSAVKVYKIVRSFNGFPTYGTGDLVVKGEEKLEKLFHGTKGMWQTYKEAKKAGLVYRFFEQGFLFSNLCWDARVTQLENFRSSLLTCGDSDFSLDPEKKEARFSVKVMDHFRLFRNLQILSFCKKQYPNLNRQQILEDPYLVLKTQVARGDTNANLEEFYRDYFNKEAFLDYLEEKQQKIYVNSLSGTFQLIDSDELARRMQSAAPSRYGRLPEIRSVTASDLERVDGLLDLLTP